MKTSIKICEAFRMQEHENADALEKLLSKVVEETNTLEITRHCYRTGNSDLPLLPSQQKMLIDFGSSAGLGLGFYRGLKENLKSASPFVDFPEAERFAPAMQTTTENISELAFRFIERVMKNVASHTFDAPAVQAAGHHFK